MKVSSSLFWGIVILGAGLIMLAQQLGYLNPFTPQATIVILAGISLLACMMYLAKGWQHWEWLFPVGIFGGLAISAAIAMSGINKPVAGTPLFVGLLIPFAAAYSIDRTRNWWALIPGGIMFFLASTTLLLSATDGQWVGALFLFMLAISFLIVYLGNRVRKWALLVAYIFAVLGIAPVMTTRSSDARYYGAIFLFAVALPFFVLYFRSAARWWAIIPAGSLTAAAVVAALSISGLINSIGGVYVGTVVLSGLALTFAVVWLRNAKPWAKPVTIVLLILAFVSVLAASYAQIIVPITIVLLGCYLLLTGLRPKTI